MECIYALGSIKWFDTEPTWTQTERAGWKEDANKQATSQPQQNSTTQRSPHQQTKSQSTSFVTIWLASSISAVDSYPLSCRVSRHQPSSGSSTCLYYFCSSPLYVDLHHPPLLPQQWATPSKESNLNPTTHPPSLTVAEAILNQPQRTVWTEEELIGKIVCLTLMLQRLPYGGLVVWWIIGVVSLCTSCD